MRILSGLFGVALLGMSGAALADEPVRLSSVALDSVTAGLWNGVAAAFTLPAGVQGASFTLFQGSQIATREDVVLNPPESSGTFQAVGVSQTSIKSSGVGTTTAFGGGGAYTGVTVSN